MFLDDERFPPNDGMEWIIVRTVEEALLLLKEKGFPTCVSFDHDLGITKDGQLEPTGYDFAKLLVEHDLIFNQMPKDFSFTVHSQNPVGKTNIEGLLSNYLQEKRKS
jgi:hypothetical protein